MTVISHHLSLIQVCDNLQVVKRKRLCKFNSRYSDSVVMSSVGQHTDRIEPLGDKNHLMIELNSRFINLIDLVLVELNKRFSELGKDYVRAIAGLVPGTNSFLDLAVLKPLLDLAQIDIINISHEIHVAKPMLESMLAKVVTPEGTFAKTSHILQLLLPFSDGFPLLVKVLAMLLTFGVSTAVCESSFSALTRILTPFRRSMMQRRLSNLVLLAFEKDLTANLDHDSFLALF